MAELVQEFVRTLERWAEPESGDQLTAMKTSIGDVSTSIAVSVSTTTMSLELSRSNPAR